MLCTIQANLNKLTGVHHQRAYWPQANLARHVNAPGPAKLAHTGLLHDGNDVVVYDREADIRGRYPVDGVEPELLGLIERLYRVKEGRGVA